MQVKKTSKTQPQTIDEYIQGVENNVQKILKKIRTTIRKAAPAAVETIKYQIPTYTLNGNLVHFAAYKNHIGFYPAPKGIDEFKKETAAYQSGKGTLQFPLDQPIPYDLIAKIVKFRVYQQKQKVRKA